VLAAAGVTLVVALAAASHFAELLVFVAVTVKLFAVRPAVAAELPAVSSTRFFDALAVVVVVVVAAAVADVSVDAADVSRFGSRSAVAVAVAVLARLKLLLLSFVVQQQPFQGDSALTPKHQHCSIRIVAAAADAAAADASVFAGQNTLPLETSAATQQRWVYRVLDAVSAAFKDDTLLAFL